MNFGRKDSFDRIMDEDTVFDRLWDVDVSGDDEVPPSPPPAPSVFRTRGQIMTFYQKETDPSTADDYSQFIVRRPWRRDSSNDISGYEAEDESPPRRYTQDLSPTKQQINHRESSKRQGKLKKKRSAKRRPRYPLDGTTPSERILASMVCCADLTLDCFEGTCGIDEEMQTINEDVVWCISFF